jgi:hypothetical protein
MAGETKMPMRVVRFEFVSCWLLRRIIRRKSRLQLRHAKTTIDEFLRTR